MKKNIYVIGLDDFHLSQLRSLQHAEEFRFHSLISYEKIKCGETFPVREFLEHTDQKLQTIDHPVDAVIGYWDFPVSTVLPVVRAKTGNRGPSLISVLKCEHKYWSRMLQQEVVPDLIPPFTKINPFSENAADHCELSYPFWIKPVKAVLSHLGFLIRDRDDLTDALKKIRERIGRYAEPFNLILDKADLPEEIKDVDGYYCIAEGIISKGRQFTLEGYVHNAAVHVYGVIDSIREGAHGSSFGRYQYPSALPSRVKERMTAATEKVLDHAGYDNSPFNIEFFWDEEADSIHLLEINPRISKSHSPLFKMVDGEFHHKIMIDVALGRDPQFPHREGRYTTAAKFMLRRYEDGLVRRVPDEQAIAEVKKKFPGTEVKIEVEEDTRLSDLRDQDSYSFEIGTVFMGAETTEELLQNYETALFMLPFTIENGQAE